MMKSVTLCVCLAICILGIAFNVWSHGVRGKIITKTGILVEAEYYDGEPMSYAEVEVLNLEEKLPFQTGRTDRNGRFLFFPDKPAAWKIAVNDGMGHRLVLKTSIDKSIAHNKMDVQTDKSADVSSLSRYEKALMGISIIFGISGFFFWWRGRKGRVAS